MEPLMGEIADKFEGPAFDELVKILAELLWSGLVTVKDIERALPLALEKAREWEAEDKNG